MALTLEIRPQHTTNLPPAADPPGRARRRPSPAWLVLGAVVVVFVLAGRQRLVMPLGDSQDGRNAGVWATGASALRAEGPVVSRLGARLPDAGGSMVYADHPPATYLAEAASTAAFGDHGWALRLPALLASLAALGLAYALLRECGASPLAAAAGVAVGFGGPLFGVYGLMADSWILGLAPAIAALLIGERAVRGRRDPVWVVFAVGLVAALTCWQALILVGALAVATSVRRRAPSSLRRVVVLGAGAAAGLGLTVAWQLWALGSWDTVLTQLRQRSGTGPGAVGWATFARSLDVYAHRDLLWWQVAALAVGAVVVVCRERQFLAALLTSSATVVVWTVGLRGGAYNHEYWAYWICVPIAVATAAALTALARRHRHSADPAPATRFVPWAAAAIGLVGLAAPSAPATTFTNGAPAGRALLAAAYPASQSRAWYLGDIVAPTEWVSYLAHRPATEISSPAALRALASSHAGDLVLVALPDLGPTWQPIDPGGRCVWGVPRGRSYAMVTAAALERSVTVAACPRPAPAPAPR